MNDSYITVSVKGCVRKVTFDDILYVERESRKLKIVTENGEYIFYERLENIVCAFDERFYPCLKGCYINLEKVACMDGQQVIFDNGSTYFLGRESFVRTKQRYYHFLKKNERNGFSEVEIFDEEI